MHSSHANAAKRAEEALAELALVRDTQQALTKQVLLLPKCFLSCETDAAPHQRARKNASILSSLLIAHLFYKFLILLVSVTHAIGVPPSARAKARLLHNFLCIL